ncbi:MAG TPA: YitT family protein [Bacilli bacterium]|nr:YitT family protein [Bacilli bacterium]
MKKNKKAEKNFKKHIFLRYLNFVLGVLLVSLAFNIFLLPGNIVAGGVSGLSIIFNKFGHIDPALFILVSSVFLLFMSLIFLGWKRTIGSVAGSLLFPLFVKLTANIGNILNFSIDNELLIAVCGGVLFGFGAGLVFKAGFTTGGTDILNQIFSKYLKISMGKATILVDGLITLAGGFVFGWVKCLYAIIVLVIVSFLVDKVLLGISDAKAFYIITDKQDKISKFIFDELNHSVTLFDAKGGYSNKKQQVLFTVIPTKEYFKFKEGIKLIDDDAFFVVADAYEVQGGE